MMLIDRRNILIMTSMMVAGLVPARPAETRELARNRPEPVALRRIRAGVLNVAYLESGPPNGSPVVLLHGFPYDVHAYDQVAQQLAAAGRRVIVPYLRGFGPTRFVDTSVPRVGQQAALGNDLLTLLDALRIERATLAGFDWGGRAACVVAALHPERVRGLISAGGPGYNIQNESLFLQPRAPGWERAHWFYYYLNSQRGMTAFLRSPAHFCRYLWQDFSPTWHFAEDTFQRTAASFSNPDFIPVSLHSYRYRIGAVPGDPALEPIERQLATLPAITVPTIVIGGAEEGVDPPEAPEVIRPHFTTLRRTLVLQDVGHNAPQEAPDAFAAAILELDS